MTTRDDNPTPRCTERDDDHLAGRVTCPAPECGGRIGDRLRALGGHAKDAVGDALFLAGDDQWRGIERIQQFERSMAAAEAMIDTALEHLGPDPNEDTER